MPLKKMKRAVVTSRLRRLTSRLKRFLGWQQTLEDHTEDSFQRLKVYLFNVGQGDHILLELPNGKYGIIDFYFENAVGLREPPALTYLESIRHRNPEKPITISFICISHPDYDHIKGADTFLHWVAENGINVENFWLPSGDNFYTLYEQYSAVLNKHAKDESEKDWGAELKDRLRGIRDYLASDAWRGHTEDLQGAVRELDADIGGTQVVLLAPLTKHVNKYDEHLLRDFFKPIVTGVVPSPIRTSAKANLVSSVLLMNYQKHRLLFGGDTDLNVWQECLDEFDRTHKRKRFGSYRANFIKASHHGSKNSSSVDLWSRISSKDTYVGISAGKRWKHPNASTLEDIREAAERSNVSVEVISTNTCTACLANQSIPQERFEWLDARQPPYKPEVARMISLSRVTSRARSTSAALGAYIFRFAAASESPALSKGTFNSAAGVKRCVYENDAHRPFPRCARDA